MESAVLQALNKLYRTGKIYFMSGIGTLQENALHAALKAWYALPGDQIETVVDGYVIDLVSNNLLVEVQTGNFSKIKKKLYKLLENHPVRLVYPIPLEKWILRLSEDGTTILGRRKSPKRGRIEHIFQELVRFPGVVLNPNFSLEALFIHMEVVWRDDGRGSWRRKGRSVVDQRLIEIVSRSVFSGLDDYRKLIPPNLSSVFTVSDLAKASAQPRQLAGKMAYCLREMGIIEPVGKHGHWIAYQITPMANTTSS
jgi:hypothetical protein